MLIDENVVAEIFTCAGIIDSDIIYGDYYLYHKFYRKKSNQKNINICLNV